MSKDQRVELGSAIKKLRDIKELTLDGVANLLATKGARTWTKQHLSDVERGGTWPSLELVEALDDALGGQGSLVLGLRNAKVPIRTGHQNKPLLVSAHLFFPLYLRDPLTIRGNTDKVDFDLVPCNGLIRNGDGVATLYAFPFHVVVLHEQHTLDVSSFTEVAEWRTQQIKRRTSAVSDAASNLGVRLAPNDREPYCFSVFVIEQNQWISSEHQRRSAQILAMPTILVQTEFSESTERPDQLLDSNFRVHGIEEFSLPQSHFGFASWAAVAVTMCGGRRTVIDEIVALEIQLQAVWCYSSNVEFVGSCPDDHFSADFLRRVHRRLVQPKSTEHISLRQMREAIMATSRISETISGAITSLQQN